MASLLSAVDHLDRIEGFRRWGSRSTADWLAWQAGVRPITAREYVRVARALRSLPLIRSAFERGEISFSKVRALTRVATPEEERSLLVRAKVTTAAELEQVVRARRTSKAVQDPTWALRNRSVREWTDAEGMRCIFARYPVAEGEIVSRAIRAAERSIPRDAVTAVTAGGDLDGPGPGERLRADALVEVARAYLSSGGSEAGGARGMTYAAVVHLDASSGRINLGDQPISIATAERLLCDAVLARATHPLLQCPWHHALVHEGGWDIWMEDGRVFARSPDGRLISERGLEMSGERAS